MATILIVDDKPTNRQFLATLLGYRKHRLLEADDGVEALELRAAEPPDLIITDLLMPTMDGYELVRQLRTDPTLATTPVILYTAKYHKSELHELMHAGGVQYLDKPSEPEAILHAVEQALAAPPSSAPSLPKEFEREHLRLLTDKLARTVDQMELIHLRMTALVDLGRQLAEERDPRPCSSRDATGRGDSSVRSTRSSSCWRTTGNRSSISAPAAWTKRSSPSSTRRPPTRTRCAGCSTTIVPSACATAAPNWTPSVPCPMIPARAPCSLRRSRGWPP